MRQRTGGWWLTAATVTSASVITAAPFVGRISRWLRDVAGSQYAAVLAGIVFALGGLALGVSLLRVRERRVLRYGCLLSAVAVAVTYGVVSRTGVADVDAAERFHFIEYGLVAVLFYKASRPAGDLSVFAIPVLAGVLVGTGEEWLQWFVPGRVGEWRDVLLNLVAVSCGVLFGVGIDPPGRVSRTLSSRSRRHIALLGTGVLLVFAVFFDSVHLGHNIVDPEAGVFQSRYTVDELRAHSRSRTERWRTHAPQSGGAFSREDQYLSEGLAHVRRRNERWAEGNLLAARHENLILERYYAPVLDAATAASPGGHRWPLAQREEANRAAGSPGFMIYDSDALPHTVVTWPRWAYWSGVFAAAGALLRVAWRATRV
jgi:hypothetical protein